MFQENRGLLDKNRTEGYLIEKGDFMDFRDLSYVLAIAKTQNITKAADVNKISSEFRKRDGAEAVPEIGKPVCADVCRGAVCGQSHRNLESEKRTGSGNGGHHQAECRTFEDCVPNHARNVHASMYTADFP